MIVSKSDSTQNYSTLFVFSTSCRYDRFSLTGCQPRTASYVPFGVPNRCPYLQRAECNGSCTWDFVAAVCRLR